MDLVLPSSPVWYQTKASDTSSDGYFAFASRSLIYLLDITEDVPIYYGILTGHEERVTTCSFSIKKPDSQYLLLASGDDDGVLKMWNVLSKTMIKENKVSGCGKITSLHWSPFSEQLIVYGDDKGCLITWNCEKGVSSKFYPDGPHQQITCVVCSPHHQPLVAVGYKSGAVSVVDIMNKGTIIRKFRGHGNEVHSIVWSHYPSEDLLNSLKAESKSDADVKTPISQPIQFESILVSGSKDRTIRIWSLMRGKAVKILKLKSKSSKGKRTSDDSGRVYVALHWPGGSRSSFISSSYNGDLLLWDLSKPDKEMCQTFSSQMPECAHQRVVFNINPGLQGKTSVVTTSMDRQIKLWSLSSPQLPPIWSLPTLGGYVYSIAVSPIDPSMVALGVGDGAIRLWKTQNPRNPFDIAVLWQGVKEKVMSLAWHPEKDGLLAFGTEDGKVGVYDVLAMKPPTLSETYHLKPVYALSWGAKSCVGPDDVSDGLWLYTCGGEGVILMHPPDLKGDGIDVRSIIIVSNPDHAPGRRSEVSWRRDAKFVAMGNDNGTYDVYRAPYLRHVVSVKVHSKIINCLRWCPSDSSYLIASGSNNNHVGVTNVEDQACQSHSTTEEQGVTVITEAYRTLIGHTSRTTGLSWNRDDVGQLASASYDGTVQVWDVGEGVGIANYRGHDGRALCVDWTPNMSEDPVNKSGRIYSGGDDYSVHVWRAEKQENRNPPREPQQVGFTQKHSTLWKKKNKKKKPLPGPGSQSNKPAEGAGADNIELLLENKKQELLADMQSERNDAAQPSPVISTVPVESSHSNLNPNHETFPIPTAEMKQIFQDLSDNRAASMESKEEEEVGKGGRRKRLKNLFPLSIALDNQKRETQQQDCIDIIRYKNNHLLDPTLERPNLGLYCDRKSTYRMLHKEDEKLVQSENYDGSYMLKVWTGDVIGAVESAIKRKDLTDQLVAMAAMGGHDVWLRACGSFADQLSEEGMHLHASNYLLACNKVREAVILLRENKLYRESVALARARLHSNDPLLLETVRVWANRLKHGGTYEMAAKCFASVGDNQVAADCLSEKARSKTSLGVEDLRSLFAAALFAKEAALSDWHKYVRLALVDVATCSGGWATAHTAASGFKENILFVRLILCVHELLCSCLSSTPHQTLLSGFSALAPSDWIKDSHVTGFNFYDVLSTTWEDVIVGADVKSKSDLLHLLSIEDIHVLCSTPSYAGLTTKQSLLKASLHLSCIFILLSLSGDDTSQSLSAQVTLLLAVTDDQLHGLLENIFRSFEAKKHENECDEEVDLIESNIVRHKNVTGDENKHLINHEQLDNSLQSVCS